MKRTLLFVLALGTLLSTGCWHSKKNRKPKETTKLATDVEASFRQRWLEKRSAELVAQGLRIDIARQQAIDEFEAKYVYIRAGK
jgi:hypothetical protein